LPARRRPVTPAPAPAAAAAGADAAAETGEAGLDADVEETAEVPAAGAPRRRPAGGAGGGARRPRGA
jgi:hypothetical protein